MSNKCCDIAWERDFGSPQRKVIAMRLADHADSNGRGIWPSVERTAAECCLSVRTVQRVLKAFVDEGLLKVVREGGKGRRDTRRYDFDMAVLAALPQAVYGDKSRETYVKSDNKDDGSKGDTVSPLKPPKGDSDDTLGCHGVTQTVREPLEGRVVARARAQEGVSRKNDDTQKSVPEKDLVSRGKRLCAAMGIGWDDPHWRGDVFLITQWDAAGYDFELDVLPTIASVCRGLDRPPGSLAYFTKPIARNHAARLNPPDLPEHVQRGQGTGTTHESLSHTQNAAIAAVFQEEEE